MSAANFSGRLKELREGKGLTQQELADQAQLAKATIADLEQERYAPTWPTAVALAGALGVDLREFLEAPKPRPQAGRGRPAKASVESTQLPVPKKKRGRPRKGE